MTTSLDTLAGELLEQATTTPAGRAARTVYGGEGHLLRQTLVALRAGDSLAEHESPGDATLLVLAGRVVLRSGEQADEIGAGEIQPIPPARHAVEAIADSTLLLSVALRG